MKRLLPPKAVLQASAAQQKRARKTARNRAIKWTFASASQADMVAMARFGQSNARIQAKYKFTDAEIAYGTRKWQDWNKRTGGLRRAWANGTDPLVREVLADKLAIVRAEIQREMPSKILHMPPEVVSAAELEKQAAEPTPPPSTPTSPEPQS